MVLLASILNSCILASLQYIDIFLYTYTPIPPWVDILLLALRYLKMVLALEFKRP